MQDVEIINVRLPDEVVKQLDALLDKKIYKSRSEIIRSLLREEVIEWKSTTKEGKHE
jgi:metal-responsive CopG/Arc/MetJ family transcriptional regulator